MKVTPSRLRGHIGNRRGLPSFVLEPRPGHAPPPAFFGRIPNDAARDPALA
jgi:hypothetical protein